MPLLIHHQSQCGCARMRGAIMFVFTVRCRSPLPMQESESGLCGERGCHARRCQQPGLPCWYASKLLISAFMFTGGALMGAGPPCCWTLRRSAISCTMPST